MAPSQSAHKRFEINDMVMNAKLFRYTFLSLQLIGGLGLLSLLLTVVLSKNVKRQKTWVSFCVSWVVFTASYMILPLFGETSGAEPNHSLCFVQSTLVYGCPVLVAWTTLAFMLELWLKTRRDETHITALIAVPWCIYAATLLEAALIGATQRDNIQRLGTGIYCVNTSGMPGTISGILVSVAVAFTLLIEGFVGIELYRSWNVFGFFRDAESKLSAALFGRVLVFSVFGLIALGTAMAFAFHSTALVPNLFLSFMPIAAFLVFLQMDIIRAWSWWAEAPSPYPQDDTPHLLRPDSARSYSFDLDADEPMYISKREMSDL